MEIKLGEDPDQVGRKCVDTFVFSILVIRVVHLMEQSLPVRYQDPRTSIYSFKELDIEKNGTVKPRHNIFLTDHSTWT